MKNKNAAQAEPKPPQCGPAANSNMPEHKCARKLAAVLLHATSCAQVLSPENCHAVTGRCCKACYAAGATCAKQSC
jgi:hypothetical protein